MVRFNQLFEGFESSNISRVRYSDKSEVLEVRFHTGKVYEYDDVPATIFSELKRAESVGKAFNTLVKKGGFSYKKVSL